MRRQTTVRAIAIFLALATALFAPTAVMTRAAPSTPVSSPISDPCASQAKGTPESGGMAQGAATAASTVDFDLAFIDMMIPHHRSAVAMAQVAVVRGEHQEVRDLAQSIIESQQAEIQQMQTWRDAWYPGAPTTPMDQIQNVLGMHDSSMSRMMNPAVEAQTLCNAAGPFDEAFLQQMLPHHMSAVAAAKVALTQAEHPEIKQLAQAIIDSQQREINEMQGWLSAWYGATPAAG